MSGGIAVDAVRTSTPSSEFEVAGYQPDVHAGKRLARLVDHRARGAVLLGV